MLEKPIGTVTIEDIEKLIKRRTPESRFLEYKKAVPVSREQQKSQRKDNNEIEPFDKAVAAGSGIGDFGRDALIEELVGFANADGGTIVLGMVETKERPPRAAAINPIPNVVNLEMRLRDQVIEQVEPRLPFVTVRAIEISDDGSGVILMEAQPSLLGPHWVRSSRSATVRREDRNSQLSMIEIHDMVMRNSRRLDRVAVRFQQQSREFESWALSIIDRLPLPESPMLAAIGERAMFRSPIESAFHTLKKNSYSAICIRASVNSHQPLGLPRLENIRDLGRLGWLTVDGEKSDQDQHFKPQGRFRRFLGGVESQFDGDTMHWKHHVERDGSVGVEFLSIQRLNALPPPLYFAALIANALAIFDALRTLAGAPNMTGEIEVEVLSLEEATLSPLNRGDAQPLPYRSLFPRFIVTDRESFETCLRELSNDLLNAANVPSRDHGYSVGFPRSQP